MYEQLTPDQIWDEVEREYDRTFKCATDAIAVVAQRGDRWLRFGPVSQIEDLAKRICEEMSPQIDRDIAYTIVTDEDETSWEFRW